MTLSVVLIARNQAWNLDRLVQSVLREAPGAETVLVDSRSTDATVERAAEYPIRVLRLREGSALSPAAGRYVGFHATSGAAVVFLDGDMELCPGWLEQARALLEGDPTVAAVGGRIVDVSSDRALAPAAQNGAGPPIEAEHTGGAGIFLRAVLDEVGTFNPYLAAEEEPELCLRIRGAGHRVVRIDRPVALHLAPAEETFASVRSRRGRNFYIGYGQVVRYHLGTRLLWTFLKERRFGWEPVLVVAVGAVCTALTLSQGSRLWVAGWAGIVLAALAADVVRRRSPRQTAVSTLKRLFILEGALRGLMLRPRDPRSYPGGAEVVK